MLLVTNKANVIYRPVHELPDLKWKDAGEHIYKTIVNLAVDESILAVFPYQKIDSEKHLYLSVKRLDQTDADDRF